MVIMFNIENITTGGWVISLALKQPHYSKADMGSAPIFSVKRATAHQIRAPASRTTQFGIKVKVPNTFLRRQARKFYA